MELKELKGVGPKTLQGLFDLGINSIDDLVRYYPYRYNVYKPINIRDCIDNSTITIIGSVVSKPSFSEVIKLNLSLDLSLKHLIILLM